MFECRAAIKNGYAHVTEKDMRILLTILNVVEQEATKTFQLIRI